MPQQLVIHTYDYTTIYSTIVCNNGKPGPVSCTMCICTCAAGLDRRRLGVGTNRCMTGGMGNLKEHTRAAHLHMYVDNPHCIP